MSASINPEVQLWGPASRRSRAAAHVARNAIKRPGHAAASLIRAASPGLIATAPLHLLDHAGSLLPVSRDCTVEAVALPSCRAELVRAAGVRESEAAILYFHGGAFVACGLRTHRRLVGRISAAAGATVLNVDYRMLPGVSLRETMLDAVDGYRHLLDSGFAPEQIVLAGDSAGGHLAFSTAIAAREHGLPRPAGVVALSPWLDLDCAGKAQHRNARLDPLIPVSVFELLIDELVVENGELDPALSPVNADLRGLPPVLIQVGSTEVLLHDAEVMVERLASAGVACVLQVFDRQIHVFQAGADIVPEGRAAIAEIGAFVRNATAVRPVVAEQLAA